MHELKQLLNEENIKRISEKTGHPRLQTEFLIWLMDTANLLRRQKIVLKGGTAVQQFIKETNRRISMDLDYDLEEEKTIEETRTEMEELGLRGGKYNRFTGALTYYRIAPTIYKTETRFEGEKINAHLIKVQVNTKTVLRKPDETDFNTLPGILDDYAFKQKITPIEMLLANKIVISARSDKVHVGRAHYKDLFDVIALINYPKKRIDYSQVPTEIRRDLRRRGSSHKTEEVITSCQTNLLKLREDRIKGFISSYRVSRDMADNIEELIDKTKNTLQKL
ncbi:MAG: nucleotidyl transferase AbiEii/AbiGii toxin family protein [Candidatus Altiarchaeota archaeon]|nr:nucleotidyl transferase AbiEii/AbiGii toxin family protein [Candidatus Altiarchaeota archaeon]